MVRINIQRCQYCPRQKNENQERDAKMFQEDFSRDKLDKIHNDAFRYGNEGICKFESLKIFFCARDCLILISLKSLGRYPDCFWTFRFCLFQIIFQDEKENLKSEILNYTNK